MPIKLQTLDSHRLYCTFLDALQAGISADDIADITSDALNRAKTSYEAEQKNIKQKEKEAAIDDLVASVRKCGNAFSIPQLASDTSDAAKEELLTFMETLRSIFDLASTADKEEEESTEKDILKDFISTLM